MEPRTDPVRLLADTAWLRRLAFRLTADADLADDLHQEVALAALRTPRAAAGGRSWLAAVARNLAAGMRRRRAAALRREAGLPAPEPARSAAELAAEAELQQRAVAEVLALPAVYRETVLRRFLQQASVAATAAAMAVPEETVRARQRRALALLRARLAPRRDRPVPVLVLLGGIVVSKGKMLGAAAVLLVAGWLAFTMPDWSGPDPRREDTAAVAPLATAADAGPGSPPGERDAGVAQPARTAVGEGAAWVVRGEVMHGSVAPLPHARFVAQLFRGAVTTGEPLHEATLTSGADGTFEWALDPPAGVVTLTFATSADDLRILPTRRTLVADDGPPQDLLVYAFVRDCSASGTVTDAARRPIAGAWVKTGFDDPPQPCAADGTYALRTSATYGETTVFAGAPGHRVVRQTLRANGKGAAVRADFVLQPAARLAGRVTDAAGGPIAGARVFTFETRAAAVRTDADGRYELTCVDAGLERHVLQVEHDDYLTAQRSLTNGELGAPCDVVLQRGARLVGRVSAADGRPVLGAHVHLGPWFGYWETPRAVSRDDGSFAVDNVPAGATDVAVFARGHAPARRQIVVPPAGAAGPELAIRLDAGHFVAGRVVDRDGNGLHRVRVTPFTSARMDSQAGYETYTARDGSFRIEDLPAGTVELDCFGMHSARSRQGGIAVDRADVTIVVDRPARLAGRVVDDATGRPVTRFTIRFVDPDLRGGEPRGSGYGVEWVRGVVFEDAGGYWSTDTERLDAGAIFGIEASAEGYGPAVARAVAEVESAPDAVVLRLRPPARIAGRVVDPGTGAAIAGARVAVVRGHGPREVQDPFDDRNVARTDAQGAFVLDGVEAGEVSLVLRHDERPPARDGPFATVAGATTQRVVAMPRGATLRGTVVDLQGNPVAGLRLVRESIVTCGVRLPSVTVATDAGGRFAFAGLPNARVWLHGSGALADGSRLLCSREVDVAAGDELDVRIEPAGSGSIAVELVAEGQPPPELPGALWLHMRSSDAAPDAKPFATSVPSAGVVLRGLPAGAFRVAVLHVEDAAVLNGSGTVTVAAGTTARMVIAVRRHAR